MLSWGCSSLSELCVYPPLVLSTLSFKLGYSRPADIISVFLGVQCTQGLTCLHFPSNNPAVTKVARWIFSAKWQPSTSDVKRERFNLRVLWMFHPGSMWCFEGPYSRASALCWAFVLNINAGNLHAIFIRSRPGPIFPTSTCSWATGRLSRPRLIEQRGKSWWGLLHRDA